ncbi:MAG: hypothetical protein ACD_20C00316G0014 [uncultured bacterium]|nr:MAG: hypothetical protein ACD_20C00316G0014 [uncultured bacterium]HBH18810.1 peptidoglycan editing factor PgeF [Cyanobacteria bacterium UBA9579]
MFYLEERSGIKYYKSGILDDANLIHAFTTRIGGNTPEPFNSFSLGTANQPEFKPYVIENRKKICGILDLNYDLIVNPDQQHTDNIKIVTDINDDVSSTDGVISAVPGIVLMMLFADCTPIIIYAPKERVVGVIHAGWRGTARGIVKKAINILTSEFNTDVEGIKVAIGPTIGQCCYPVSSEVALELANSISENHSSIFKSEAGIDKVQVDLKKLNAQQLIESGIINIDTLDDCTSCKNSLFYSYRKDNGKTGRHSAIASLL